MSILYTIRVTLSKVSHISETERQMTHLPNRLSRGTTGLPSACPGAAHRGGRSRLAGDVRGPPVAQNIYQASTENLSAG